jgi:hypothetical protein
MAKRQDIEPAAAEQELRARLAEVERQIATIDAHLREHEAVRDAAEETIRSVNASDGSGSALELWKAEEARDRAADAINELLAELSPLKTDRGRLAAYVAPSDTLRREIAEAEATLAASLVLREVLPAVDELLRCIVAAREACRASREVAFPRVLERFSTEWHRDESRYSADLTRHGPSRYRLLAQHQPNELRRRIDMLKGRLA